MLSKISLFPYISWFFRFPCFLIFHGSFRLLNMLEMLFPGIWRSWNPKIFRGFARSYRSLCSYRSLRSYRTLRSYYLIYFKKSLSHPWFRDHLQIMGLTNYHKLLQITLQRTTNLPECTAKISKFCVNLQ